MMFDAIGGRIASGCAILLAAALAWQTARIEGWPLVGGGFKAQVAGLEAQAAARALAEAQGRAAAWAEAAQRRAVADRLAARHLDADRRIETHVRTVIQKVPIHVRETDDAACIISWGVVRLLDAAASGAALSDVAARIAPGQPDDAASDAVLSEIVALLAENAGVARRNAEQLRALQQAWP